MAKNADEPERPTNIDDLDDYSLANIFRYLSFKERVSVERVCKRWKDTSREYGHLYSKTLIIGVDTAPVPYLTRPVGLNQGQLYKILRYHCRHMEYVRFDNRCRHTLNTGAITLVTRWCPRLTKLDVTCMSISNNNLISMNRRSLNLEHLIFAERSSIDEQQLTEFFSNTKTLKRFNIAYKLFMTGNSLLKLNPGQLDSLWIEDCSRFHLTREVAQFLAPSLKQYCFFGDTLQYRDNLANISLLTNLRRLLIRVSTGKMSVEAFHGIIENCRLLDTVDMGKSLADGRIYNICRILELPKLKDLAIMGKIPIGEECVLMDESFNNIERLMLGCTNIMNADTYFSFVKRLPDLRFLSVCNCSLDDQLPWVQNPEEAFGRNVVITTYPHHMTELLLEDLQEEELRVYGYPISPAFSPPPES